MGLFFSANRCKLFLMLLYFNVYRYLYLFRRLLQLLVTIVYQFFIMRDLEKLIGWLRLAIIYLFSGIAGSLASAIFLPYHVEV